MAALAALLAVGAAALGVVVSQLYQDRAASEPPRYADAASRDLTTQPDPDTGTVPLLDSAALASNTARPGAQAALDPHATQSGTATPAGAQPADPAALATTESSAVRRNPAQHAVNTAAAKPAQPAPESPGVSRAAAHAATEALTQDAITPLSPDTARVDPTQPHVTYSGHPTPSPATPLEAAPRPPVETTTRLRAPQPPAGTTAPTSIDDEPAAPTDGQ